MIAALFTLLIYICVLGILWYAFDYAISHIPIPDPPARFIRILLVVIFCLIIVVLLLNLGGVNAGINLPKLA